MSISKETLDDMKDLLRSMTAYATDMEAEKRKVSVTDMRTIVALKSGIAAAEEAESLKAQLAEAQKLNAEKEAMRKRGEQWALANARNEALKEWTKVLQGIASASEERYQFLEECRREAEKWKAEGDMYGWNFHMGMAGGANWTDLFYQRVIRALKTEVR